MDVGDYSFCILTILGFIKVYENVMNLYAVFNVITEMKHNETFSQYLRRS